MSKDRPKVQSPPPAPPPPPPPPVPEVDPLDELLRKRRERGVAEPRTSGVSGTIMSGGQKLGG